MLFGIRPIQNLLATENVKHVLDIGAGKGYLSLFAASYGAQIDAVEPTKRKRRRFPPFLKRHPNITHHELPIQEFSIDKPYDLVICKNVIMFLKRTYVLEQLLPELLEKISSGGVIVLSYMDESDKTVKAHSNYELSDFAQLAGCEIVDHGDSTYTESHPPYGEHTHHEHLVILKKNV